MHQNRPIRLGLRIRQAQVIGLLGRMVQRRKTLG